MQAMGMPHPLGSALAWGVGTGIDNTAAAWRRYYGLGGYLTGYPLGYRLMGKPGMGGYYGVRTPRCFNSAANLPPRASAGTDVPTMQGWELRD